MQAQPGKCANISSRRQHLSQSLSRRYEPGRLKHISHSKSANGHSYMHCWDDAPPDVVGRAVGIRVGAGVGAGVVSASDDAFTRGPHRHRYVSEHGTDDLSGPFGLCQIRWPPVSGL